MSNRRAFLRLLGVSPIAAPVAAREAAKAMGVAAGIGGAAVGPQMAAGGFGLIHNGSYDEKSHLLEQLAEIDERAETVRREVSQIILDPDIASLRSISPSVARAMQVERQVERFKRNQKSWIERRLSKITGGIL